MQIAFSQTLIKSKEIAHENGINCLEISNDDQFILTGGMDNKTYLWNSKTLDKLKGSLKQNEKVSALAINNNGKFYAVGSSDSKIRIVDIELGIPIRILSEHTLEVTSICFHPFSNFFVSTSKDKTLKFWDNSKSKNSIITVPCGEKEISCLEFSPDGTKVYAAFLDGKIKCYDYKTGKLIDDFYSDNKEILSLKLSSDGSLLAFGNSKGDLFVYDINKKIKVNEFSQFKSPIKNISISGDLQYISACGENKKVIIWNLQNGKLEKEFIAHEKGVSACQFSINGELLYTIGLEGTIKLWDVSVLKIGEKQFPKTTESANMLISGLVIAEENNNGLLDPEEKASIQFSLQNLPKNAAYNMYIKPIINKEIAGVELEKKYFLGNLDADSKLTFSIPIKILSNVSSASGAVTIDVFESSGKIFSSQKLQLQTSGANAYSYILISEQGFTSATGKADVGAPITLKLKLKNIAKTDAKNVKVNFLLPENVKAVNKISELISQFNPGEEKEISMDFYVDKTFTQSELKMLVDIEGVAFTNAKEIILKLKLNEKLPLNKDYSNEIAETSNQLLTDNSNSENSILYRGSADPLKGLNISKPKEMVIGNYYALIIGIDKYSGPWTPLSNAVNDAKAIEKILRTSYKFDNFKTLYNETASRESIIKEFEWLIANVKENDNIFIFYSGHGEYKKELSKGFWVPIDAINNSTSKFISNSDIQTYINGMKSKHTLLISDACFSVDIFRGNTISVPFEESEKYYREVNSLPSRQALTSGGIEPVMDGGKDGHSVFAYYLLKTLEANKGKYFDVTQLYTKLKILVINNSEQTPKLSPIKNAGDEGGQFIFIRK